MNKATALWLLAAVTALSCASGPPVAEPVDGLPSVVGTTRIEAIEPEILPDRTRVVLRSNAPLLYTSYAPESTRLILELQDVDASAVPPRQEVLGDTVGEISVSTRKQGSDHSLTTVEFRDLNILDYSLRSDGTNLVLDFLPSPFLAVAEASPAPAPAATETTVASAGLLQEPQPIEEEHLSAPLSAPAREPSAQTPPQMQPAPEPLPPATRLESVDPVQVAGGVQVQIRGDGVFDYRTFTLQNPNRLVLDLIGVRNVLGTRHLQVGIDPVEQVRVAQFKADPEPVSRVVLDLFDHAPYHVSAAGASLQVSVGQAPVLAAQAAEIRREESARAATAVAAGPTSSDDGLADAAQVELRELAAGPAPSNPAPEPIEADAAAASLADHVPAAPAGAMEEMPEPAPSLPAYDLPDMPSIPEADEEPFTGQVPLSLDDMGLDPTGEDYVLFGQDTSFRPQSTTAGLPPQFQPTTIAGERSTYTGEPISVHFVDAELKNVFLFFSEFIGLNIVIDPEVRGTLTMHLTDVPWDQAFDVILRHQGLEKAVEGNVVRIATTEKLRAEAAQRQALKKAQEGEVDTITFTRVLSYAKVSEVGPILITGVRSDRGRVVNDPRTNTLIITDVPDRQSAYQRLIDVLDKQTQQVMIEARIVETDRNFEHNLGIDWQMFATADPALGTQTSLDFPHRASLLYDVNLPAAASAGTLGLSLGNVLDSFTLDIALTAFENEGKVRILSAPKITTQNNQTAIIEQGTQIPVVTTTAVEINVQYISASLKLEVTPQITAEGTVIMDVVLENNSPDFVNRVGDVPPIITEKAQTQILVRDGSTAVIGGIFKLSESHAEAGVPGLRKIPVLGWLFKNRAISKSNQELLIFITPKILRGGV